MVIENTKKVQVNQQKTRRHHWLSLLIAVLFCTDGLSEQSTRRKSLETSKSTSHFNSMQGTPKLPPGKYIIHMLDNSDLTIMEISRADGSHFRSLLSPGRRGPIPRRPKSELIFNKYGNRYFPCEGV